VHDAFNIAKESFDNTMSQIVPRYASLFLNMAEGSDNIAYKSHNHALNKMDGPNVRRDLLETFHWTVESAPVNGAVLPDCVALAYQPGEPAMPLMFVGQDMQAVVMPLSTDMLLVGHQGELAIASYADFNKDAATCSREFFLSNRNDTELAGLIELIGSRSATYLDETIRGVFDK
jgi:hypothetical protein